MKKKAYVYETAYAGVVLITEELEGSGVLETNPNGDITGDELARAARETGYEVTHWRWVPAAPYPDRADGFMVEVGEDGEETASPVMSRSKVRLITKQMIEQSGVK